MIADFRSDIEKCARMGPLTLPNYGISRLGKSNPNNIERTSLSVAYFCSRARASAFTFSYARSCTDTLRISPRDHISVVKLLCCCHAKTLDPSSQQTLGNLVMDLPVHVAAVHLQRGHPLQEHTARSDGSRVWTTP